MCGIDLDHCVSEGKLNKTAAEVVSRFKGSYIETSSSGTGLRIFCFGKPGRCGKGTELKWIEVYDYTSSRYLTVTGLWWEGTSRVVTPQQQALDWLYEQYFKPKEASKSKAKDSGLTLSLGKQEIIEKAKTARNGGKFSALFYGEWQAAGYPSQSEADAALCSMLAFWTQDEGQIDWIFRQSALMRKKWDERHDASGKTYGGDDDPQCPRYSGRDLPRRR